MHHRLIFILVLASSFAAPQAAAIDFVVDTLFDGALDHDTNPGDGVCASSRAASCSLRAAIQEANARSGQDRILFDVAGTIGLFSEGPMPNITDPLVVLGSSAPGYDAAADEIGDAPPQIVLDGALLPGSSADGLVFSSGASSGYVDGLAILNMPDDGILISGTATQITVDGNWIGIRPSDGSAAGNADFGIHVNADGNFIGAGANAGGISGLGNLVSANGDHGISIAAGADGNRIRGNLIGFTPSGAGDRGNAGYGIFVAGSNNRVGELHTSSVANAPVVGYNGLGGVYLFGGSGNRVEGGVYGVNVNGASAPSPGDGIRVTGSDAIVGGSQAASANLVANHSVGIGLGDGVLSAAGAEVRGNRIGAFTFSQGTGSDGIRVENAPGAVIADNIVLHAGRNAIRVEEDDVTIEDNVVGYSTTIFGVENRGSAEHGIRVSGDRVVIRRNTVGFSGRSPSGFNDGIALLGSDGSITGNFIGVTAEGVEIGNDGTGIRVGSTVQTSAGNTVSNNTVMYNGSFGGISLYGTSVNVGNRIELNRIAHNASIAVNLIGEFGREANDAGDGDEGPNRLINTPEIVAQVLDPHGLPPRLTVTFRVDTNTSNASYPLLVDFSFSNAGSDDVLDLIGTAVYEAPDARLEYTAVFDLPHGTRGGYLVAQTVDATGNASEVSLAVPFGDPDVLFQDGFEDRTL